MNKIKAVVFGMMICSALTANAATKAMSINGDVGKIVKLSLESNPTTGYGWMIKHLPEELIFVSSEYSESNECQKDMMGCGGEDTFYFIGNKKGESTLKLIHGRSFDKSDWEEKDIKVVIK